MTEPSPSAPLRLRGLMLDAARLVESPDYYRRFLDFCAAWQINAVIFRLTDDQGSALRFRRHPELLTHPNAPAIPPPGSMQPPTWDSALRTGCMAVFSRPPAVRLRWRGHDTAGFRCEPVRLRFEFVDAEIYNVVFQCELSPTTQSIRRISSKKFEILTGLTGLTG